MFQFPLISKSLIKIAVVGDVHELWQPIEDRLALQALGVDLVLFVGDFGNEAVEVVRAIASLDIPKAIILGNHDAWYSTGNPHSKNPSKKQCPYDRTKEDRVQQQLEILGETHVGYGWLDFPELRLSVVGARPFSSGGSKWKKQHFYRDRYGINCFTESTQRITEAVKQTSQDTLIFLGHSGPWGLGADEHSPCGKDWKPVGGDYGDPDLMEAISKSYGMGKQIPLVTFGHMHHRLRHNSQRTREAIATNDMGTVFLNAACSPRLIIESDQTYRSFSIVTLESGQVQQISLLWLKGIDQISNEIVLLANN
ncbi:TIGR04168 family protein [Pseudanabaena sp. FACHB-1277]|uniref:TIGR04168 family protein n=1 Tax=Pseudanabaena cinerea FACHB-1277 TaxID=2949581 RepID=A0A926URI0_9CYAN|nr:TIGR04168 family protein [Pseudanabaena cinerea FACHB-1277]